MCKETWLSSENDSGGLVQLSKGYRLEKTDDYGSKMVKEPSIQAQGLDADAIKAKHIELKNRQRKEIVELGDQRMTSTLMYTSQCPQCKEKSNKWYPGTGPYAEGYEQKKDYVPRIKYNDDLSGIKNDIEIAQKERKKIKDQINEKRAKLRKLIEKAEKEEESSSQESSQNHSQISSNEGKIELYASTPKKSKSNDHLKVYFLQLKFHEIILKKGLTCHDALKIRNSVEYKKAKDDWFSAIDAEEKQKTLENKIFDSEKTKTHDKTTRLQSISKKIQKNSQSNSYEKEIDVLKTQIAELRAGVGSSSGLEYWENQITELEQKKTSYVCENCKTGLEKNCDFCKIEHKKLKTKQAAKKRTIYPLLRVDLPVCDSCVRLWGKEAILSCL